MTIESDFIDAINADPDNRFHQLVYADWLDEQADPRAEAWRVLIEAGKRPVFEPTGTCRRDFASWNWYYFTESVGHIIPEYCVLTGCLILDGDTERMPIADRLMLTFWPTIFAAMDAAAVAWVRVNRPEIASFVGKEK